MLGLKEELCMCEPTSYCLNTGSYILVYMVHGMLLLCNEWKNLELFKPQENV